MVWINMLKLLSTFLYAALLINLSNSDNYLLWKKWIHWESNPGQLGPELGPEESATGDFL